eukprot:1192303-Prorocentrum_minimum.AAC.1
MSSCQYLVCRLQIDPSNDTSSPRLSNTSVLHACGRLWTACKTLRCENPTHMPSDPDRASHPDPGETPWTSG